MAYNTDLTDRQWDIVCPLFPVKSGRGRPTELDLRLVLNAVLYLVRTGCQWRNLPNDLGVFHFSRREANLPLA